MKKKVASLWTKLHTIIKHSYNQYLQESKLQPKVKVVVYQSEADNSGKNHSTSTRSPVQTQETVYELSRSRRNKVSLKQKLNENYKEQDKPKGTKKKVELLA